jgi:hypothetical protein
VDPRHPLRWFVATLSFGAGVIHLSMVSPHAQESLGTGLAFAAAGWSQVVVGAAVLTRPTRRWADLAIVGNLVLIAAWVWSRTAGLPSWTGDGGVEPASAVDILCVALEAGVVAGALALRVAPGRLDAWRRPAAVASGIAAVGVLGATSAVLAAPGTAQHGHGGAGEHGHEPAAAPARHHGGEHGVTYEELPAATRAEVDQVIDAWAHAYPTAADATRAGWSKITPSLYGIGAHYARDVGGFSVAAPFDLLNPSILLYDGEGPDARFAGVSYIVGADTEGFTGRYDVWHTHPSLCVEDGRMSLTEDDSPHWYSESECTAAGATLMPVAADRMIHVWIGPGYDDGPIFAHDSPELYDGYYPKRAA